MFSAARAQESYSMSAGSRVIDVDRRELDTGMAGTADDTRKRAVGEPLLLGGIGEVKDPTSRPRFVHEVFKHAAGVLRKRRLTGEKMETKTGSSKVVSQCVHPKYSA